MRRLWTGSNKLMAKTGLGCRSVQRLAGRRDARPCGSPRSFAFWPSCAVGRQGLPAGFLVIHPTSAISPVATSIDISNRRYESGKPTAVEFLTRSMSTHDRTTACKHVFACLISRGNEAVAPTRNGGFIGGAILTGPRARWVAAERIGSPEATGPSDHHRSTADREA
jgi:hypothetical protein